jgi:hypothetical protein
MKNLHLSATLALCLSLTACGGAPSEGDMKKAVLEQSAQQMAAIKKMGGGFAMAMPEIKNLTKIGCKEDGEKAYRCDVEIEVKHNGQVQKSPATMRFTKGSDGWLVSN